MRIDEPHLSDTFTEHGRMGKRITHNCSMPSIDVSSISNNKANEQNSNNSDDNGDDNIIRYHQVSYKQYQLSYKAEQIVLCVACRTIVVCMIMQVQVHDFIIASMSGVSFNLCRAYTMYVSVCSL